jgi:hypothetical protein
MHSQGKGTFASDRPDIPRGVPRVRGNAAPEKRTRRVALTKFDSLVLVPSGFLGNFGFCDCYVRHTLQVQVNRTDMWAYLDEVRLPLMEMNCSKE